MKSKKIKKSIIFLILVFLICLIFINTEKSSINTNTELKDIEKQEQIINEDGLINNAYFNISSDGKNAKQTTNGINGAINYASKNNISYIKLEKGTYLIDGKEENYSLNETNTKKGIILQSNIVLDLNGSTIIQETNGAKNYANISVNDVENVSIMNGILVGDKDSHDYTTIESSHEWGFGIDVRSSKNIKLNNLEIYDMTGDGIFLMSYYNTNNITTNVEITNCNIYECRRQGISIIHAENVQIFNNEIANIGGIEPGLAIDLEPEMSTQFVNNVEIRNNKLYDGIAMQRRTGNITISENEIYDAEIKTYQIQDNIKILGNTLINTNINMRLNTRNGERVEIGENNFQDSEVYVVNISNLKFNDNNIKNNRVVIVSTTGAIYNNRMDTDEVRDYGMCFTILSEDVEKHTIYNLNNNISNNYTTKILNYNPYAIEENVDKEKMNEYLKIFE